MGFWIGRLRIYALEAPMRHELHLPIEVAPVFIRFMEKMKDQWTMVGWIGLITISGTLLFMFLRWKYFRPQ